MVGVSRDCKQIIGHGMFDLEHQVVEVIEVGYNQIGSSRSWSHNRGQGVRLFTGSLNTKGGHRTTAAIALSYPLGWKAHSGRNRDQAEANSG